MRKTLILIALTALAVPVAAIAHHKPSHAQVPKTVQFVLKGTVTSFTAEDTITITFQGGNMHAKRLFTVGASYEFDNVTSATKVVSLSGIAESDVVLVKVKAPKAAANAAAVQALLVRQIVELEPVVE
jgi:hypothetical protein